MYEDENDVVVVVVAMVVCRAKVPSLFLLTYHQSEKENSHL